MVTVMEPAKRFMEMHQALKANMKMEKEMVWELFNLLFKIIRVF